MTVGAPFNPYRVFQGVFAPYWILEHKGISTGAKLCYIRLLGFAGKDARCYPSLERLGTSLGVSERQARDYVKELERAGLIVIEQRGLRKTNVYLFLWTKELEQLINHVPDRPDDPDEPGGGFQPEGPSERNRASAPDRNSCSGLDRKSPAALGRNQRSGPIGINSEGISSVESSSSSTSDGRQTERMRKTTSQTKTAPEIEVSPDDSDAVNDVAQAISRWATERGVQRLRVDRRLGLPDEVQLERWATICVRRGILDPGSVFAVFDAARAAADRSGEWRNWSYLTIQVQLAVERYQFEESSPARLRLTAPAPVPEEEEPATEWAKAKGQIRGQIPEIPFLNWFRGTRQIQRRGTRILVEVPDEPTRSFLESEYDAVARGAVSNFGIDEVCYVVRDAGLPILVESSRLPPPAAGSPARESHCQGSEVRIASA